MQAATGEKVSAEELGGAKLHASQSGLADYLLPDERSALQLARQLMAQYPAPESQPLSELVNRGPLTELYGLIPKDSRQPYDVREIIYRLVDAGDFIEFKQNYGTNNCVLLCPHWWL